jgi:hypothetical protein
MTNNPSVSPDVFDEMHSLVAASLSDDLSPEQDHRLIELVHRDSEALDLYLKLVFESSILLTWAGHGALQDTEVAGSPEELQQTAALCPPTSFAVYSFSPHGFPVAALRNTASFLSSGWPVAYLVATVAVGIGLWIGSITPAFYPQQIAKRSSSTRRIESAPEPQMEFVGRITAIADCQLARNMAPSSLNDAVPVGREVRLESGLMEITYNSGAKVILQGPVTYRVESAAGGFLSLGKLTARLEKGEGGRGKAERDGTQKSGIGNQKSPSPLSTIHYPLFTIKTPTATVTDLGTEFGVEVAKSGETTSHVFRGSVRVQMLAGDGKSQGAARVLHENQSARVERSGGKQGGNRVVVFVPASMPSNFVREIPKRTIKVFDLVDVVAGGDGFSGRRNHGINPTNGRLATACPIHFMDKENNIVGDWRYHAVEELPFLDGVFIPDGSKGAVQTDSAGHTFDFPPTDNITGGHVWAGGLIPRLVDRPDLPVTRTELDGVDYASGSHGLIFLLSNKGVTFDLDAIRRANPGYKLGRFLAVAGNTELASAAKLITDPGLADVWVLVDGQARFRRRQINAANGGFSVAFAVRENDRFLTLAATDGGDTHCGEWILFADPRIELLPRQP